MFVTIRNWFRRFFNALVLLSFIGCVIAGYIISEETSGVPLIGVVLGFLVALVINVIFGGFVATIISIDTNLEKIRDHLDRIV